MLNNENYLNRLAGCVILYNPPETVIGNISNYITYLDKLIVIDNSEIAISPVLEKFFNFSEHIIYLKNGRNKGIATALNIACQIASDHGFKWILTMDQDSYIIDKEFFEKSRLLMSIPDLAIIAASHNNYFYRPQFFPPNESFLSVDIAITSGNILNLDAWAGISRFNDKLFIDEVDNEFCIRLKLKQYKIIASKKHYLIHHLGVLTPVYDQLRKKNIDISLHSTTRLYYITRNNFYIWKKFFFKDIGFVSNRIKFWLIKIYEVIMFYPHKSIYLKSVGRGVKDFVIGRYGRLTN